MKHIIYRQDKDTGQTRVVATFTNAEREAMLAWDTLNYVAHGKVESNAYYQQFIYAIEKQPEPRVPLAARVELQVDTTAARPTKRPIKFKLSYHLRHDQREYLAYSARYGTVRGTCKDSPHGGALFISRVADVWPNAEIEKE